MIYILDPSMSLFGPEMSQDLIELNNIGTYGTLIVIGIGTKVFIWS